MDDRFNRNDKPEGQEVRVSRDADGELVLLHRVALDGSSSPEAREALLQAASATASFRHPQVLAVREVRLEGDSLVFVQDYPHGPLLADTLAQGDRLSLRESLQWVRQFAHALAAAQASGLTLSQICPTEFVVQEADADGAPTGLLCLCPPVPEGWWLEVEDPVFASPEQKNGLACDIRSTMYSAGAVLGVMVTGQRPLSPDGWNDVLSAAKLPLKVSRAIKAALESDPGKRSATPKTWMALLDEAIASLPMPKSVDPTPDREPEPEPEPQAVTAAFAGQRAPATVRAPSLSQSGEAGFIAERATKPTRNPLPWVAAALGLVLLAVGAWLQSTRKSSSPAKIITSSPEVRHSPPVAVATPSPSAASSDSSQTPSPPEPAVAPPAPTTTAGSGSAVPALPTPQPSAPPAATAKVPQAPEPPKTVVPAPRVAAVPEAGPKPVIMAQPPAPEPAPPPTPPPAKPEPQAEAAKKIPEMPLAIAAPTVKPKPLIDPAPAPAPATKPTAPSKDELLRQAAEATAAERPELYRKVLEIDSRNRRAIQGLVEAALADLPHQGPKRDELMRWVNELAAMDDPLGFHALGCIALQESADAKSLLPAIKSASDATTQLKHSLHSGYSGSYNVMVQAYIDLHNFQLQNREKPKADRTSKALLDEIARAPEDVPAQDSREFAERLENLLKERAAKGPPRMQEAFLKTVMQSLYATAAKRGDDQAQKWMKTRH